MRALREAWHGLLARFAAWLDEHDPAGADWSDDDEEVAP